MPRPPREDRTPKGVFLAGSFDGTGRVTTARTKPAPSDLSFVKLFVQQLIHPILVRHSELPYFGIGNMIAAFSLNSAFPSLPSIRYCTFNVLGTLGAGGGYIYGPTHNIQTDTPPENVVAMYDKWIEPGRLRRCG